MVTLNGDGLAVSRPAKRAQPAGIRTVPMVWAVRVATIAALLAHRAHQFGRCPLDGLAEGAWDVRTVADLMVTTSTKIMVRSVST